MRQTNPLRPAQACLLLAILFAGPTACSPSVSDMELNQKRNRRDESQKEEATLVQDLKVLNEERRALAGGFTGPVHMEKVKKADSLKEEKAELEAIKADVDEKVTFFTSEAKRHREALAKAKP